MFEKQNMYILTWVIWLSKKAAIWYRKPQQSGKKKINSGQFKIDWHRKEFLL